MDTIPLPAKPDVDQYRKRAKELVRAAHDADPQALRVWGDQWLTALYRLLEAPPTPFVRASLERAVARVLDTVLRRYRNR